MTSGVSALAMTLANGHQVLCDKAFYSRIDELPYRTRLHRAKPERLHLISQPERAASCIQLV
jgi:hypothetical protein